MSAQACGERAEWDGEVAGVDAQARERAAGAQHAQAGLEGRLGTERLDCDVDAATVGEAHDRLDRVDGLVVDDVVSARTARTSSSAGNAPGR